MWEVDVQIHGILKKKDAIIWKVLGKSMWGMIIKKYMLSCKISQDQTNTLLYFHTMILKFHGLIKFKMIHFACVMPSLKLEVHGDHHGHVLS